jgi:hypothetical protein
MTFQIELYCVFYITLIDKTINGNHVKSKQQWQLWIAVISTIKRNHINAEKIKN